MKFFDESSGATIHMDRYYCFSDGGGLAGSFEGYASQQDACIAMMADYQLDDVTTDPKDLGAVQVCILTGQQLVDRLREIDGKDSDLSNYGRFVE